MENKRWCEYSFIFDWNEDERSWHYGK